MPTTTAPLAPIWVPVWEPAPPGAARPAAAGAWIVAGDDAALADEVAARLGASAVSGPSLVRTVSQPAGSIAGVCYLAVARSLESGAGIAEVLALVQALGALPESRQPRLVIVTRGAQAIGPAAGGDGARRAPLWGLARVVRNKYPALRCGCVDLDPLSTDEECAAAVAGECWADDEDQVAWRNHERLALRLRAAEAVPEAAPPVPVRLVCRSIGNLDSLAFEPAPVRSPGVGEVLVAVRAAGLNFQDVRHALGAPELTAESAFGLDAAGVVMATGAGVESLTAGDRVMVTLTPGSMAHQVVAREHLVTRLPANLTFAEGAGAPLAFLTAWHALISIAQLKAGERVLIHAATGGVGQAAIQVARARGAVVFATASAPKQRVLKEQGIEWIFDSRTPDFSAAVLAATGGRGVEVVLNCLTGDMIRAGLDCTARGGRFVEIGPTGGWPAAQVAAHRPDLRYSPFDLAEVARAEPGYIKHLLDCIADGLVAGTLRPIRTLAFREAAASEAFRLVSRARHVGKVAIVMSRAAEPLHEGVHLVTGGFGALGRALSAHLREAGVRRLALVARAEPDDERREFLASLQRDGVDARAFVADLADAAQVADLLGRIGADFAAPITAIYHTAGELADGIIAEQTPASLARVAGAKLTAAWNLHRHTRGLELDRFVLFSSAAALIGTPGQSNYAAANAGLDALAAHRRSEGLPALSVNWGPWDGSGMAARLGDADRARMAAAGVGMLEDGPAWRAMLALIARGDAQAMVMPVDWSRFNARFDGKYVPSLFRGVPGQAAASHGSAPGLHIVPALRRYLQARVAATLGRPEAADIASPAPVSVVADEPAELPLSHGQSALYRRHQLQPESPADNIAFAVRVRSAVDETALRLRVGALVERHAQLRRVYRETERGLRQLLVPAREVFTVVDVAGATEHELRQRVVDDYRAPFDLAAGPLIRVSLFSRAAGDHVLLFTVHHIAADAWSLWRMMEELLAGDEPPAPAYRYADKLTDEAAFLQSPAAAAAWAYWTQELGGELPVLNLLTDKPRPAVPTLAGASVPFRVEVHETERLQVLARQTGTTLHTLLLAAFQTLLHRYTNQDEILVGCPVAGRNQAASAATVGHFVNPVVVRARIDSEETFDALLSDTRRRLLNAVAHQDLPFPLIAERFGGASDPGRSPIFQAAFVMEQLPQDASGLAALMAPAEPPVPVEWGGLQLEPYLPPQQEGQFDLTLEVEHAHGACHGLLRYRTDLWEAATIERMAAHFRTLLHSIADAPTKRVRRLAMVPDEERAALMAMSNGPRREYDLQRPLHQWIEDQVRRTPAATALEFGDQTLTYAELNRRANGVARLLRAAGVGVGDPVPIVARRSVELVVGLLGALKSGGAYVPLDPADPPARRDFMIADLSARVILDANRIRQAAAAGRDENLPYRGSPDALAYTIYTSGSTGMPNGAQNTHRGIVNRLCWMQEVFTLTPDDRVLQKTPSSVDVSVWEFLWPLMAGARLVLARPDGDRDNHYLATLIRQAGITALHFVPPLLRAFLDEPAAGACTSLRRVVCSGQELPASVRNRFFEVLPGATLHNLYGPTEAAGDVTWHACRPGDQRTFVPIGAPIANTSIHIVDSELAMTPIGVAGELYIGGVQVARGYLNRPELTAERFVANPFAAGGRMYRTGDLARYLPDGEVELLGRTDFQVKIRGLRVEPGEVEHALTSHPDVRDAIVLLREDRPGTTLLTAYLVTARADAAVLEQELRRRLGRALPADMVPDAFVLLPALPLTSNGKVDRKALPAPPVPVVSSRAAETDAERTLAAVWKDVLGLDQVGADDNFFSLGGDSIRGAQMIALARRHGYDFTVRDVLLHPTLAALARLAHLAPVAIVKAAEAPATGEIPLLPMQHWFFGNGGAGWARFNQAVALGPDTTLQVEPLRRALDDLVSRHEALRLRFPAAADGRRSAILVSAAEAAVHFGRWDRPFDVEAGPMMAAELVADGAAPRLVLTAHHLIVDGVSWRTLVGDLEIAYRARAAGRAPVFADETPSYVAWARALVAFAATAAADAEAIHWLTEDWRRPEAWPLAAAPVEATPAGAGELVFELPAEPLSGQEMEAVLLATLAGVLDPDVRDPVLRVDLEGHGRAPLAGADGSAVVGWCAALFPALLRIEGESSSSRGASVARMLAEIPAGGRAFGLARYLSPRPRLRRALASVPPASILFNYLGRLDGVLGPSSMFRVERPDGQALRDDHLAPLYPLEVHASVHDGALRVSMRFDRARVSESWLQALAARWRSALADAATEAYPLTPMQKGILFHALREPESGVYVQQLVATFDGSVDERWWRAAWDTVLDRHPVLRNAFEWKGLDQPMQQPVARVTMPWVTIDARGADRPGFEAALASFLDEDRQRGFDLASAPLHRVRLFLRDGGGTLVWTYHHILLDGRSVFQVLREVLDTMRRYASGQPLPAATGLFRPFAAASNAAGDASAIAYWRGQLQGFEAPTPIPFLDRGLEADGQRLSHVVRTLAAAETEAVRRLARDAGVTLNLLMQSLLALLLSRWSGQDRVMFGATVSANPNGDAVGLYINTIPVVVPVPATPTVREWLADCQRCQAERLPFEQMGLAEVQRCSRIAAGRPMFDLLFVFENYGIDAELRQPAGGVSLRTARVEERTSLPLVLSAWPGDAIELRLRHDSARYPREAAEQLVDSLAGVLRAAVQAGLDTPLKTLTPLDAATRRVLA